MYICMGQHILRTNRELAGGAVMNLHDYLDMKLPDESASAPESPEHQQTCTLPGQVMTEEQFFSCFQPGLLTKTSDSSISMHASDMALPPACAINEKQQGEIAESTS